MYFLIKKKNVKAYKSVWHRRVPDKVIIMPESKKFN